MEKKPLQVLFFIAAISFIQLIISARQVYFAEGYHGGYFLTDEATTERCFYKIFSILDRYPNYKVSLEFEPYAIERMKYGAKFKTEL